LHHADFMFKGFEVHRVRVSFLEDFYGNLLSSFWIDTKFNSKMGG
jgi:hypothetical protein